MHACSVAQSCLTLLTPWTATHQASLFFTISQSLLKLKSIEMHIEMVLLMLKHTRNAFYGKKYFSE